MAEIYPRFTHESGTIREKPAIDVSKLKRLLCYESQHQSQSNEKSLVQFDYEKAVSNYLGTQSTFTHQSKVLTKPHTGKEKATSQHSHRGQQTLRHVVPQAWGAVLCMYVCM